MYERLPRSLAVEITSRKQVNSVVQSKKNCAMQEYKKIKDKRNLTGCGRTEWKYFSKLDEIPVLGAGRVRPVTCPAVLLVTLDSQPIPSDHDSDETDVEGVQESNVLDHSSVADDVSDNQNCSGSNTITVSVSGTLPSNRGSAKEEISTTDKVEIKGKKRKQSKGEVLEDAMTKVMKTMTDGLRSSDKMFMELEEKDSNLKNNKDVKSENFS